MPHFCEAKNNITEPSSHNAGRSLGKWYEKWFNYEQSFFSVKNLLPVRMGRKEINK